MLLERHRSGKAGEGVERRVLAFCDELMCVENTFEKGGIGAMHHHPHTQITYVASGRFRFTIGDEVKEVGPGDTCANRMISYMDASAWKQAYWWISLHRCGRIF